MTVNRTFDWGGHRCYVNWLKRQFSLLIDGRIKLLSDGVGPAFICLQTYTDKMKANSSVVLFLVIALLSLSSMTHGQEENSTEASMEVRAVLWYDCLREPQTGGMNEILPHPNECLGSDPSLIIEQSAVLYCWYKPADLCCRYCTWLPIVPLSNIWHTDTRSLKYRPLPLLLWRPIQLILPQNLVTTPRFQYPPYPLHPTPPSQRSLLPKTQLLLPSLKSALPPVSPLLKDPLMPQDSTIQSFLWSRQMLRVRVHNFHDEDCHALISLYFSQFVVYVHAWKTLCVVLLWQVTIPPLYLLMHRPYLWGWRPAWMLPRVLATHASSRKVMENALLSIWPSE